MFQNRCMRYGMLALLALVACQPTAQPSSAPSTSFATPAAAVGAAACPAPREPGYLPWNGAALSSTRGAVSSIRSDSGVSYFVLERRADTVGAPTSVTASPWVVYGRATYLLWTGSPGASEMSAWWEGGTGACHIYHARLLLPGEPTSVEAQFAQIIGSIPAAFVDPAAGVTGLVAEIHLNVVPSFLAVMPTEQRLYVTDRDPALSVYDTSTNTLLKRTPLPLTGPVSARLAVVPFTRKVYVLDFAGDRVLVYDGTTLALLTAIAVGRGPTAIAADWKADRIYVANLGTQSARAAESVPGSVTVIDGAKDTVIATVPTAGHPIAIDVSAARVYVGALPIPPNDSSFIEVIDTFTSTEIAKVGVSPPSMLVADPVDNVVYGLSTDSRTAPSGARVVGSKWIELDTRTYGAATFVDGPGDARAIGWHAGSDAQYRRVYVASQRDVGGALMVYEPPSPGRTRLSRLSAELRIGADPGAITVDSAAHLIYVTSTTEKTISVIVQGTH
jgi:DNA-binding beta-propeller fold protein YncE